MQQGALQTGETTRARGEDYLGSTGDIRRLAVLSWLQANHLRGEGESARLSYYPRFTFTAPVPSFLGRGQLRQRRFWVSLKMMQQKILINDLSALGPVQISGIL